MHPNILHNKIELVIFDVDGTLYHQQALRWKMLHELAKYYLLRPGRMGELKMIYHFRKEREKKAGAECDNLYRAQYEWAAKKVRMHTDDVQRVVDKWIFRHPLPYIQRFVFAEAVNLIHILKSNGILTAVFSDYAAADKLEAMGIQVDLVVSATDDTINSLKPSPKGIEYICRHFNTDPEKTVLIGDRYSKDGLCAQRANITYLHLPEKAGDKRKFFIHLTQLMTKKDT